MPRCNGSYIGIDANPNANVASGIWTVREAETYLRANKWPATPTVPGAPTGTAGNEQVALTWSAPTGGSTPTDYEVQYSSNGGSTWTTFSDGVSSATSATVTGLTNGTGYIFRVRAVNILGEGPYGSASGTVTPADTTKLLLHFDGSNGSTTFTDSSTNSLTITKVGDAEISTAESKFGGASGYFTGGYVYADGADIEFGGDDWTIEFWTRASDSQVTYASLIGKGQVSSTGSDWIYMETNSSGENILAGVTSGSSILGVITANEWHHVAFTRNGSTLELFIDGVSAGASTLTDAIANVGDFYVGTGSYDPANRYFTGYIDDLRVVIGTAVYTGNFTPPTGPY